MVFFLPQAPAEQEQQARTAVCSLSFTAADDTTAASQSILGDARGAPSLQAMTWINCMVIVEDEEVRNESRDESNSHWGGETY